MKYNPRVLYEPGKNEVIADTLSRAPGRKPLPSGDELVEEVECLVSQIITSLPATPKRLHEIQGAQLADEECNQIKKCCLGGYPYDMPNSPLLRPYWENKGHQAVSDSLLLFER